MGKAIDGKKLTNFAKRKDGNGDEQDKNGKGSKSADLGKAKTAAELLPGVVSRVENEDIDERAREVADGFDPGEDAQPFEVQDSDLWNEAVKEVEPEGEGETKYSEPWLVTAMLYQALGGEFSGKADDDAEAEEDEGGEEQDQ
jgi:hypothetical protein